MKEVYALKITKKCLLNVVKTKKTSSSLSGPKLHWIGYTLAFVKTTLGFLEKVHNS